MLARVARDGWASASQQFVDTAAPHPEFVLAPPTARITAVEFDDIIEEIREDTQKREALEPELQELEVLRARLVRLQLRHGAVPAGGWVVSAFPNLPQQNRIRRRPPV